MKNCEILLIVIICLLAFCQSKVSAKSNNSNPAQQISQEAQKVLTATARLNQLHNVTNATITEDVSTIHPQLQAARDYAAKVTKKHPKLRKRVESAAETIGAIGTEFPDIPADLMMRFVHLESDFNDNCWYNGCYGYFQLMECYHHCCKKSNAYQTRYAYQHVQALMDKRQSLRSACRWWSTSGSAFRSYEKDTVAK